MRHFVHRGLDACERLLAVIDRERAAPSAVGDALTAAELLIVPQMHFARRFAVPLDGLSRLHAVERAALATEHADAVRPERQPGAPAL